MYLILYILVGWIWQFPQTFLGWFLSQFFKDKHIGPAGFKYVLVRSPSFPVICLGEYLFIGSTNLTRFIFGRAILSRRLGPLFIPLISLPSITLILIGKNWFMSYWGTKESMKYGIKIKAKN
jgi:hypothetical protein